MSGLTKEEYLKKYLSGDDGTKKKKKRRPKIKTSKPSARLRIVDDDVDFKLLLPENIENTLEEDVGDDDPTIAEVVDERPDEVKHLEQYRKNKRWKTLDAPRNKTRHDSDSDLSPERSQGIYLDSSRVDESDIAPEQGEQRRRKSRFHSDSDQSPLRSRKTRFHSDSDQSPPRARKSRFHSDSDQSPPRARKSRFHSDSDQSPPRSRKSRFHSDSDQSPPRARKSRFYSDSDQSPPRSQKSRFHSDSDQSPPRSAPSTVKLKTEGSPGKDRHGRPQKTLGGATAGLSSARQMREEAQLMRERENDMFSKLDDSVLGRNAKTVFRERKKKTKEELQKEELEEARKAERDLKYKAWNKGLKQGRLQEEAALAAVTEMSKPLTRHQGDADLEDHLKAQAREGDPMLAFIKKKPNKDPNKKELPRYKGPQPPMNRFNLWPGYRWDGVDRSNGFEKQIITKASEKTAVKEIAYKWSVEDM